MTEYKDILTKTKSENSKSIDEPESFGRFIGTSPAMQKLYDLITKAAPHHTPVFITGETGTGKEICAQSLHSYSSCHQGPFIALNCAALPLELAESALFGHVKGAFTGAHSNRAGAIAKAEGGSLFLDEICDMPLALQSKLLRFCQDYTYRSVGSDQPKRANIRIICATNRDPLAQIKKGKFREDLYYRLHIIPIAMPPLRKRQGDIMSLIHHYLHEYNQDFGKKFIGLTDNTQNILSNYHWPGNIRELQNILSQIVTLNHGKYITTDMLPETLHSFETSDIVNDQEHSPVPVMSIPLWQIEKNAIEHMIEFCNGNIVQAAAILDIAPSTIYRKLQGWKKK